MTLAGGRFLAMELNLSQAMVAFRRVIAVVALFSLGINLLLLTAPLYMLQMFDRVLSSRNLDTLLYLTLIALFAFLVLGVLEAVRNQVMVRLGGWLDKGLGGPLLAEGVASALSHRDTPSAQGLRDIATCRAFLSGPGVYPLMDAPWTPVFLMVIYMLHPALGGLATGAVFILLALAVANEASTRRYLARAAEGQVRATEDAEAAMRNADVIQAMGMLPALVRRWTQRNGESLAAHEIASLRGGRISAVSKFFRLGLQICVLGLGAYLVLQTEMSPGGMIAASILAARALAPIDMAIGSWKSATSARRAWKRVRQKVLLIESQGTPAMALPAPTGALKVENVMFGWPGATEPLIRRIDFSAEPGTVVGLIGPTASGKTTLARLLVGIIAPTSGHVRLDGADVAAWGAENLGPYVGYLPQDVELFGGSVRENISRMGKADPEQVVAAAQLAGVHEMILGLPKGYDTEIGPGGAVLSGGQRQRIALARAVFGAPRLVVLDEPNASLDHDGEQALVTAVEQLRQSGATVVIIAHRPNILRCADTVLILRNGVIEKSGPADQVFADLNGSDAGSISATSGA